MYLRITIDLSAPTVLNDAPADGLLARLWFDRLKREGRFNGDYAARLPFLAFDEEGFYRISMPLYQVDGVTNRTLFKKFDAADYAALPGTKATASLFVQNKGRWKSHLVRMERLIVPTVTIYANGDGEAIADLLKDLRYLGKKSAHGAGRVVRVLVEAVDEDYSVVGPGGFLMRHVPAGSRHLVRVTRPYAHRVRRLVHPYWDPQGGVIVAQNIDPEVHDGSL